MAAEWGWVWPANRRILYNRASAAPDGTPWSERKKYVWWDAEQRQVGRPRRAGLHRRPGAGPRARQEGAEGPGRDRRPGPVRHADRRQGLAVRPARGLADGPMPTHYEPPESPVHNPLYGQQNNPARRSLDDPRTRSTRASARCSPTSSPRYRLTEHHTAGAHEPHAALPHRAPAGAVLRGLAAAGRASAGSSNGGWATIVTARTAIEARVLVTDRMRSLRLGDRVRRAGGAALPLGRATASRTGDSPNDLVNVTMDPNVYIQDKVGTCDIRPGRRPRGAALTAYVEDYRRARRGRPRRTPTNGGRD